MPVPTLIIDLSTTAASNFPSGADSPSSIDDTLRAHASFIAELRDDSSANASFTQAGTGAVATTVQDKLLEFVSSYDYGVTGNGVTDDTAALIVADAAAASLKKTLRIVGTPLISSTVTLTAPKWQFEGSHTAVANTAPTSYIKKKSTMTTDGLLIGANTIIEGGGVVYASGATGDGIHIVGNSSRLYNVSVIGVGKATTSGVGIRIGKDAATSNANSWLLDHCNVAGMSGHGIYIHDKPGFAPDANAGNAIGCFANNNGGDGIRVDNAAMNTFTGCLGELNTGNGITIGASAASATTYCYNNAVIGGDYEANIAGQLVINPGARNTQVMSETYGVTMTDNGYQTKTLERVGLARRSYTPGLVGSTGTNRTPASYSITGSTMTVTDNSHGYTNGQSVWMYGSWPSVAMLGVFSVSNVSTNTYDVTLRSDNVYYLPTGSGALSGASSRLCGTYSTALGSYQADGDKIYFEFAITTTAITNITGTVQLVCPVSAATINSGNLYGTVKIDYYSGITHTGSVSVLLDQGGSVNHNFFHNMGSGITPVVMPNTALAAATTVIGSGWFFYA